MLFRSRVFIIDFDVHHGNGTNDAFYDDPDIFFLSTHRDGSYHGTGKIDEVGHGSGKGRRHQLLNEICSERGNNGDGDLCHDKGFEGHDSCFKCSEVCDSFEVNQKSLSRRKCESSGVGHESNKSLFQTIYVIISSLLIHVLFHIFKEQVHMIALLESTLQRHLTLV